MGRRILIDQCVPPRVGPLLRPHLPGCEVTHTRELEWNQRPDQEVVRAANGRFDALLSVDRGLEHQHNWRRLGFGLVIAGVNNNQMSSYGRILPELAQALLAVRPGEVRHVVDEQRHRSRRSDRV